MAGPTGPVLHRASCIAEGAATLVTNAVVLQVTVRPRNEIREIEHCTVSVAILDVGQSRQKLQQLYGILFNFQRR